MAKKKSNRSGGLVYSTNPEFYQNNQQQEEVQDALPHEKQKLLVRTDTKQRAGKVVTVVSGFVGNDNDITALGKQIKTYCGTGGTVKEGLIIIQGDYRQKILIRLKEWGYVLTKG